MKRVLKDFTLKISSIYQDLCIFVLLVSNLAPISNSILFNGLIIVEELLIQRRLYSCNNLILSILYTQREFLDIRLERKFFLTY